MWGFAWWIPNLRLNLPSEPGPIHSHFWHFRCLLPYVWNLPHIHMARFRRTADLSNSMVTFVHRRPTTFVQLQSLAIFGHLNSSHPCCLLATSGLQEGRAGAYRESRVTWDTFSGWRADILKFGHVQFRDRLCVEGFVACKLPASCMGHIWTLIMSCADS